MATELCPAYAPFFGFAGVGCAVSPPIPSPPPPLAHLVLISSDLSSSPLSLDGLARECSTDSGTLSARSTLQMVFSSASLFRSLPLHLLPLIATR